MNWNELKKFCNSLPEDQLEKNVVMWREESAISDIGAEQLQEDHYMDIEEDVDGCYPESEAQYPLEELKKVWSKGDAILFENF